jgi:hypothetical protein
MEDKEFSSLKLQLAIAPGQARWRPPDFTHWQKLHEVPTEARARATKALAAMSEVDANSDLTAEGKAKERAKIAEKAIADAKASKALDNARDAVERQQHLWAEKFGLDQVIKPAEDLHTTSLHAQIREHISGMKEGRLPFLQKHAADPLVASSVLTAPAFLSGLSDAEVALVRHQVERALMPEEIAEAKADAEKALAEAEHGWQRHVEIIAERAGLAVDKKPANVAA